MGLTQFNLMNKDSSMENIQLKLDNLPIQRVDKQSPVPLYHQIYLDLKKMILEEDFPPNSILPPEIDIANAYHVGRQTVRMAIARLVDDNLVERFAGRGTFIKSKADRVKFYLDRSFTNQTKELGAIPRSKVLSARTNIIDLSYPEILQDYLGTPCFNLKRVRLGKNIPICYQSTIVITAKCAGIEQHNFNEESLYEVLAKSYHLYIERINYIVRAVTADEYRAELLKVAPGFPLLYVNTAAYLDDGSLIETTSSYYRSDKYEYSTNFTYCK